MRAAARWDIKTTVKKGDARGTAFLEIKYVLWAMAVRGVQLRGAEAALVRSYKR